MAAHTPHSKSDVEESTSTVEELLLDKKMESMIKRVMKRVGRAEWGEKTNPKKAKSSKDSVCHRCGKRGHFAKQCGTEGPETEIVLREQKDGPASNSAPPPPEN